MNNKVNTNRIAEKAGRSWYALYKLCQSDTKVTSHIGKVSKRLLERSNDSNPIWDSVNDLS